MNYKNIYDNLVAWCQFRGIDKKQLSYKTHRHHIIPKCVKGEDVDSNYVLFTFKEHKFAHHLLTKMYPNNNKLKFAYNIMQGNSCSIGYKLSDETKLKMSNARIGIKLSHEHKCKIGISNKGKIRQKLSDEHKVKISNSKLGIKNTKDQNEKIRNSCLGRVPWNKGKKKELLPL